MNVDKPSFFTEIKFMLAMATVCALLLVFARAGAGSRADLSLAAISASGQICGIDMSEDPAAAVARFNQYFILRSRGRIQFWQSRKQSDLWLCQARGAGMWAEITLLLAYNKTYRRIIGMRVLEQNETSGLGDRIGEEEFYEQFADLEAASGIEMKAVRIYANQFDAVSGATITSRAVETIINKALRHLDKIPVTGTEIAEVHP